MTNSSLIRLSHSVRSPAFRRKFGLPDLTNSFHFPAEAGTTSRFATVQLKTLPEQMFLDTSIDSGYLPILGFEFSRKNER